MLRVSARMSIQRPPGYNGGSKNGERSSPPTKGIPAVSRHLPSGSLLSAGLCALVLGSTPARAEGLAAGAARIDITPRMGFPMWGYGAHHDMANTGVLDPLQARPWSWPWASTASPS